MKVLNHTLLERVGILCLLFFSTVALYAQECDDLTRCCARSVTAYGAVGNGNHDDTPAFQKALDEYKAGLICEIIVPPGIYLLADTTSGLNYVTNDANLVGSKFARGIRLRGFGEKSILRFNCTKKGVPLFNIDGSAGSPNRFQNGGYLKDIWIESNSIEHGAAIQVKAWWRFLIEGVVIRNYYVKKDSTLYGSIGAIYFPKVNESNPDDWASGEGKISRCAVEFCHDGWGLRATIGTGFWSNTIENSSFGGNEAGGILAGGSANAIVYCSIYSNGYDAERPTLTGEGGIKLVRCGTNYGFSSPLNWRIAYNELDGNREYNILMLGLTNSVIEYNRNNSWFKTAVTTDGRVSPPCHFKWQNADVGNNNIVNNGITLEGNMHRWEIPVAGSTYSGNVICYDFNNSNNNSVNTITNPVYLTYVPIGINSQNITMGSSSTITKYANFTGNTAVSLNITEGNRRVKHAGTPFTISTITPPTTVYPILTPLNNSVNPPILPYIEFLPLGQD